MRKALKWVGIVLGGLVGVVILAVAAIYVISSARFNKTYDVSPSTAAVPTDAASIEHGRHLAVIRGCTECHGPDLSGKVFISDPAFGTIYAANLTSGQGGVGAEFSDADFFNVLENGVDPESKSVYAMPVQEFTHMSDQDLADIIAYIRSIPPVDAEHPEPSIGPLARILYLQGQLPLMPAELIDHNAPRPTAPEPGPTVEYGAYLAITCSGCHNPSYSGGPVPGAPPGTPPAANITQGGELIGWSEADFATAVRTGVKPSGRTIDEIMPVKNFSEMTDDEVEAIWLYLKSLPPTKFGVQ
jgi:mono/diheme cytochrome c family protein